MKVKVIIDEKPVWMTVEEAKEYLLNQEVK